MSQYKCQPTIQIATNFAPLPSEIDLTQWCSAVTTLFKIEDSYATFRFADEDEIQTLNHNYRDKDQPTNVLSFPFDLPVQIPDLDNLLGDIIICPAIIEKEAKEQSKSYHNHMAHIVVHGLLHLLGYDHIEEADANIMEDWERQILKSLNINDPYLLPDE